MAYEKSKIFNSLFKKRRSNQENYKLDQSRKICLCLLSQWKPIEHLLEQKTDNKHHLERFSQMLVKVESVAGAIEISVVIAYCTSCTSEKNPAL